MKNFKAFAICLALVVLATAMYASAGEYQCQACTHGFFKNHPQFIAGNSCASFTQDTPVSNLFPAVDSCVGNLSLLGLLSSPTNVCGSGTTFAGAEVILLRQAITRVVNATNSTPNACKIAGAAISKTNATINDALATDNIGELKSLANKFAALNDDDPCTIGQ
jgi:hypothetical protein